MPELSEKMNVQKEGLERRAVGYRAFASYFLDLPTADMITAYREFAKENADASLGAQTIARFFELRANDTENDILTAVSVDRTYLVRGTTKKGPKPPYGSMYLSLAEAGKGAQAGSDMLLLKAAYRDAGLALSTFVHEPPDYMGVELVFMAALLERASEELEAGDALSAAKTLGRAESFFLVHLEPLARAYASEALSLAKTGFCAGIMELLCEFVDEERQEFSRTVPSAGA